MRKPGQPVLLLLQPAKLCAVSPVQTRRSWPGLGDLMVLLLLVQTLKQQAEPDQVQNVT